MKIRVGFVTNSSSTSYCIIGVEGGAVMDQIVKSLNVPLDDDSDVYEFFYETFNRLDIAYVTDCDGLMAVGETPERALEAMTLPQACEAIADKLSQAFGVHVPVSAVQLLYGTAYN